MIRGLTNALGAVPALLFVALFAILPAAVLFATGWIAAGGLGGVARIVGDPVNRAALGNSLEQGTVSTLAAVVVGYPVGVFLGRYEFPGRGLIRSLLLVPFLLPVLAVVVGVHELFAPGQGVAQWVPPLAGLGHGIAGIVVANVIFNAPIVALLTSVGVESSSVDLEETVGSLGGGPWRTYRDAWGRTSWVGAAAGGALTFLFSALAFPGPLLLCGARCYTLEARIWALDQILLEPTQASVVALVTVGLLVPVTLVYVGLLHRLRRRRVGGRFTRRRTLRSSWTGRLLGAWTGAVFTGVFLLLLFVVAQGASPIGRGQPVGGGFVTLFGPRVTASLGISTIGALANSLVFAALVSGITVLTAIAAGAVPGGRRGSDWRLSAVLFAPVLLSPVVLALALATFWRPLLGGESAVWLLIVVSQATLALPFAVPSLTLALVGVPRSIRESAQALGASAARAYVDVEIPRVGGALTTCALFGFALGLGEFTATNFLATPAFVTLPVELYRLQGVRLGDLTDAVAALLVLVSIVTLAVVSLGGDRAEL